MSTELQALKLKRLRWVESNRENGFDEGINRLLTELYPDNAHFIYELLQNAEDPEATEVKFDLTDSAVEFVHNGKRLFEFKDVESITSIGNSTKRDDETSIGKFGVGFKAVFAYTNTPEIHSGDFHFRIRDLVVPETDGVEQIQIDQKKTQFIFPFDNSKKSAGIAVQEIEKGLRVLGDNTLLFLGHIRKIEYTLPDGSSGSLRRLDHKDRRIEIRTKHPEGEVISSHWLHFQKDVKVTDDDGRIKPCRIAVAYQLEPGKNKSLSTWQIVPVKNGGQVSIYFPAEKETSKLHFHIHAPFASTVARDSVRDCLANQQLRDCLGDLIADSLITIKKQGMLNMSFLAVLPNQKDCLTSLYEPLRKAIVDSFNQQSITPAKNGKHAKANTLYRGQVKISEIINDKDLRFLTNDNNALWMANPPQKFQREDNFLDSLEIKKWDFEHLTEIFKAERKEEVESWLLKKNDSWLISFYEVLYEAKEAYEKNQNRLSIWQKSVWPGQSFPLVRVCSKNNVKHVKGDQAYFAPEDNKISPPNNIEIVKTTVFTTSKDISQNAKCFLEKVGVRRFDEKAAIEWRLSQYEYNSKDITEEHYNDIKQFIEYWKNNRDKNIFQHNSFIFDSSKSWKKCTELCIDSPFLSTGLADLIDVHNKEVIWQGYSEKFNETELNNFIEFIQYIGIMSKLEVIKLTEADAKKNPNAPGGNWTPTGFAKDYSIVDLEKFLVVKRLSASRLIWNAILAAPRDADCASFKPNQQYSVKNVDSQLVNCLKSHAWIVNSENEFCTPRAMTHETLRPDFPFNDGNGLLTKLDFGKDARDVKQLEDLRKTHHDKNEQDRQQTIQSYAKGVGLDSAEELAEAVRLTQQLGGLDELRLLVARKPPGELPSESVTNTERRHQKVMESSADAPDKESIQRERSIQVGITDIKAQAKAYLRPKYKNDNHEMICQCCREIMPFKLGENYYFEAVQFINNHAKRYYQNYLALCPVCAAMYKYARETDDAEIYRKLIETNSIDNPTFVELSVNLADESYCLYFVGTHSFDLKTILQDAIPPM